MSHSRFTRTIGLGMTLAAFGASTAAAQPADLRTPDAIAAGQETTTQYTPNDVRTPDTVSASKPSTTEPVADMRTPDARDHGQGRGTFNAPEVTVVKVLDPAPTASGFDWADAGIGAGGLLGLILLALGGTATIAHRKATPEAHMQGLHRRVIRLSVMLPTSVMALLVLASSAFAGGGNWGG